MFERREQSHLDEDLATGGVEVVGRERVQGEGAGRGCKERRRVTGEVDSEGESEGEV